MAFRFETQAISSFFGRRGKCKFAGSTRRRRCVCRSRASHGARRHHASGEREMRSQEYDTDRETAAMAGKRAGKLWVIDAKTKYAESVTDGFIAESKCENYGRERERQRERVREGDLNQFI